MAGFTAVVAGATGLIGSQLIRMLLDDPAYSKVVALVRKETGIRHEKLLQVVTDYAQPDLEGGIKHYLPGARLFCCLGTTIKQAGSQQQFRKVDLEYPLQLGRLSRQYGADRFLIVTSMGANAKSSIFYNRVKGEVEAGLTELQLPSLHIFRPSLLLGERQEARSGEAVAALVSKAVTPLLIGALRKYKPIEAISVAAAMLKVSKREAVEALQIYESDQIEKLGGKRG